jgi:hypothetical protein
VESAGVGAFVVDRTTACFGIQKLAIATGSPSQTEDAVLEIEVLDKARLGQTLGYVFGVFVLGLKGVDQLQAHQVGQFHLDRHGAAIGGATVTQTIFVARPGFAPVDVNDGNRGSHGAQAQCATKACAWW